MPRLEKWSIVSEHNGEIYQEPKAFRSYLSGICYDHDRVGKKRGVVTTSRIVMLDLKNMIARTHSGTTYTLGIPDTTWLLWVQDRGYSLKDFHISSAEETTKTRLGKVFSQLN